MSGSAAASCGLKSSPKSSSSLINAGKPSRSATCTAVIDYAQGELEARSIVKAFTRTRALIVKLLIENKADIDTVMNYWTTGLEPAPQGHATAAGVHRRRRGQEIDVVHMLPPLPRKLLMTYPDTGMAKEGIFPTATGPH